MIKELKMLPPLPDNYYSGKIISYFAAYRADYDFCRFYGSDTGTILVYNMNMVIDGVFDDDEELNSFIALISPLTIECPVSIAERVILPAYKKAERSLFRMIPKLHDDVLLTEPDRLARMYEIVCTSFGVAEPDLWFTDMSHRIRHGISRAYIHMDSCAAVDFTTESSAYISNVATSPESRGKGHASALLQTMAKNIINDGKMPYLWCYKELDGFYEKAGFVREDTDLLLIADI